MVGHRRSSDLALLQLWCRLEAVALIRPVAWEPTYATGLVLKRKKKEKKKGPTSLPQDIMTHNASLFTAHHFLLECGVREGGGSVLFVLGCVLRVQNTVWHTVSAQETCVG